jgi:hypothetical protein
MTPDVTSLLPLLPEMPRLPAADALAGAPASNLATGAEGGPSAPDFAGLLEALAPPPPAPPASTLAPAGPTSPGIVALPEGSAPAVAAEGEAGGIPAPLPLLPAAPPRPETSSASALAGWPTGKNLPQPGAALPPSLPLDAPAGADAALPLLERLIAAPEPLPGLVTVLRAPVSDAPTVDAFPEPDPAERPAPPIHPRAQSPDSRAPLLPAPVEAAAAPAGEDAAHAEPGAADSLPLEPAVVTDPGAAPQPVAALVTFVPVLADDAVTTALAPAPPASGASPTAAPTPAAPVAAAPALPPAAAARAMAGPRPAAATSPEAGAGAASRPAPSRLPASSAQRPAPDRGAAPAESAPAPVAPVPALAAGSGASPDAGNPAPATAATTLAASLAPALPQTAAMLPADRPADPRAAAAGPPVPQLESAIAQVGDIREALRAARPAMTLQHADFGAVAIRLEPAAPDQWRAVLASRDPGFVPAIQAALETRIIAAAADTSANFAGQHGASHNGAWDQRYGASPNGGQGSPQPYLGQSGTRDGEAAPDHRRPSTAATLAARGGSEAEDPAAATPSSGGLFA